MTFFGFKGVFHDILDTIFFMILTHPGPWLKGLVNVASKNHGFFVTGKVLCEIKSICENNFADKPDGPDGLES